MPRQVWPLHDECPIVQVHLRDAATGLTLMRTLLADTGAGKLGSPFELVLSQSDGQRCGERFLGFAGVGGAVSGLFPVHAVHIELPTLGVARQAHTLIVPTASLPHGFDGFACFRFLNAFTYGNFGQPDGFGLEVP